MINRWNELQVIESDINDWTVPDQAVNNYSADFIL